MIRENLELYQYEYPFYDRVNSKIQTYIKSLEYLNKITKPNFYDTFNIGTGQGSSVFDLINSFEIVTKQKLKYKIGKRRNGDVGECYANVNKANKILNATVVNNIVVNRDNLFSAIEIPNYYGTRYVGNNIFLNGKLPSGDNGVPYNFIACCNLIDIDPLFTEVPIVVNGAIDITQTNFQLITGTAATSLTVNLTASDQYLAIVVPGKMFAQAYRDRKLAPENLSRTLEDAEGNEEGDDADEQCTG